MTEAKGSSKTPATTATKKKGDKERDVISRVKELLPQWEIQKVEGFCAEHNHDFEKIQQALDSSFERTGHQPDDWQVATKKEQKPKKASGPRESPRGDRPPRGDRGDGTPRGGGRGGRGESRGGRGGGRGGGERRGGRGGRGGKSTAAGSAPEATAATTEPVDSAAQADVKADTSAEPWGTTTPAPTAAAPAPAAVAPPRAAEPQQKVLSWAERIASSARKAKVAAELQSHEAFPAAQQRGTNAFETEIPQALVPAVVHVQPPQPQQRTYGQALLSGGNSRWGKKPEPQPVVAAEPVVDSSMVTIETQTASISISSFPSAETQLYATQAVDASSQVPSSDVLVSIPVQEQSFPQAEAFQPEPAFQPAQAQPDSFIYQTQDSSPALQQPAVSEPKSAAQTAVFVAQPVQSSSASSDFATQISDLRTSSANFSHDNSGGKLVIDLLAASNSVILPSTQSEQLQYEIQFGSFGQTTPPPASFVAQAQQPEPQPEPKPVVQQPQPVIEQPQAEPQPQLSQPTFASNLREESPAPSKPVADSAASQFPTSQAQYFPSAQTQSVPAPTQQQSASQPSYRGPPSGTQGMYDPASHYYPPYPDYSGFPSYNYDSRDSQAQSYHNYNDQYAGQFGGSRRPQQATTRSQPYYPSPTARGGSLLNPSGPTDASTGSASPPTSEPVSPNSASKGGPFASKPAAFATKQQPFANAKIPTQIPTTYTAKPQAPASTFKPPASTTQPTQKQFKPSAQPQADPHGYMPYPAGVYAGYPPYPYPPYQPPGQMPPGFMPQIPPYPYDPRYGYPYGPVQPYEGGEYEYSKPAGHYPEGGTTPRGGQEWSGTDGQKPSGAGSAPSGSNTSSGSALPSSMSSAKSTVAPGASKMNKPARFEGYEGQHFDSGYGFGGAPASSPMAMHATAAPYQPNYGQPMLHMGGQAPYGGAQYDTHPRGYGQGSWGQ